MAFGPITLVRSCASCTACVLLIMVVAANSRQKARAQQFPFGTQHQAYRTGTLFPTNFTRAQQNAHITAYYDDWKNRWLKPDPGGNGWRVLIDNSGRTVSEGQGYGMVIVPLMSGHDPQARTIFDGLWQFRLAHPSSIDDRLMDWAVPDPDGNDSAFDGDADIAYGLLLAHAQWGSGGTINYLQQAKNVIAGIKAKTIGPTSKLPMLGDWVNPTSTGTHNQWGTRSSDFMLGHFRAWARPQTTQPIGRVSSPPSKTSRRTSKRTSRPPPGCCPTSFSSLARRAIRNRQRPAFSKARPTASIGTTPAATRGGWASTRY